jgi:hypothetical protein
MLVSHMCMLAIADAEQGPEETPEPALVKGVNLEQAPVHLTTIP